MSYTEQKTALRRQIKAAVRTLTPGEITQASAHIRAQLTPHLRTHSPGTKIMSYSAMSDEVNLDALPSQLPQFQWYLPAEHNNSIQARRHTGLLFLGRWNTHDPSPHSPVLEPEKIDIILIPGAAFSPINGTRLGRGAGHYDRFLARAKKAYRIGICLACQLVPQLPQEAHDIPVHTLVSEKGLIRL